VTAWFLRPAVALCCARKTAATGGARIVVFLDSPIERLVERNSRDKRGPAATGRPARHTRASLAGAGPLYSGIADYRFCADRHSAKALAREIADHLRSNGCFV